MNPFFRNALAVIVGAIIGSIVNMSLIEIGHYVIALPEGADVSTYEALKTSMLSFGPEQYIFPFLAHALGTLVGALIASKIAVGNKLRTAMIVGVLFLIAGISNCFMLPAPFWFMAVDVLFAYIPMAYLGWKLSGSK
ncbi:hypothetical protein [Flavobacterium okayamense]|uniref:Uncharacterized protein n=1 Tax=Flavobacterium okayamense TaxID=2830782 RepID=A0ABM7S6M2_9FLAO|nr:hypothetical protein [Flavobacterium okayamense]BCY29219.1 hypothetical protein KK2020170_20870 [Flavobacterium okayamense]